MDSFLADLEPGVESKLIDLDAVSMRVLRELDDAVLRQALRHVVQQTSHPQVIRDASSQQAERVD